MNNETNNDLSYLTITLLKGVMYRDDDEALWQKLLQRQAQVRDYLSVLGLELVLDEAEGFAFVKSRVFADDDQNARLPRLVARRPLSFPVSLLLALLRKKLAEFDASGGATRLVMNRDDIGELFRIFAADSSNQAKLLDQLETHLNKIIELGFLRRLKTEGTPQYEVLRIVKAFVDAQWLAEFEQRLAAYRQQLNGNNGGGDE